MSRILIVEDEPLVAMLLNDWLTELGHQTVGPAASVPQALDLLDRTGCDVAILDLSLGLDMSYPVAEQLTDRQIPFALATGHGEESVDARYRGHPSLSKPYDFAAVEAVIEKLMASKGMAGEVACPRA
jgi:CheY-like chemotaxis protein